MTGTPKSHSVNKGDYSGLTESEWSPDWCGPTRRDAGERGKAGGRGVRQGDYDRGRLSIFENALFGVRNPTPFSAPTGWIAPPRRDLAIRREEGAIEKG